MPNPRASALRQSPIRAMTQRCRELGGVNMGQGICDTPPPRLLLDAVPTALAAGHNTYSRYDGVAPLREALADKLAAYNGLHYDPETEVLVTLGSTGAFAAVLGAHFEAGDALLLLEPYYGYHRNLAELAGLELRCVAIEGADGALDLAALEAAAAGARGIVVNSPNNPSGRILSPAELDAIAAVCARHDLLCIADEIYEYFLYDGRAHHSMATRPGMRERTFTLGGYSKTYSITGWRIGYCAAPAALAAPVGLVADLYTACAPTPLQHAVAAAIRDLPPDYYEELARSHQAQRDQFCAALKQAGLPPRVPQGAYYVLADVAALGCTTAAAAAQTLLEQAGIAAIPGSAFYTQGRGEHLLRFCFGKTQADLDRACERLAQWARAGS